MTSVEGSWDDGSMRPKHNQCDGRMVRGFASWRSAARSEVKADNSALLKVLELYQGALLHEFDALKEEILFQQGRWDRTNNLMAVALAAVIGGFALKDKLPAVGNVIVSDTWIYLILATFL